MGTRRAARELAVQFLFMSEFQEEEPTIELLRLFWADRPVERQVKAFAQNLIDNVLELKDPLDLLIRKYVQNWDFSRIAIIERNILRLSFYEILYRSDIPDVASINEAVDIAKKFSTPDSGKFVNGILDRVKHSEEKRYQ